MRSSLCVLDRGLGAWQTPRVSSADRGKEWGLRSVEETVRAYFDALERSAADDVAGLFTDDAVVMAQGFTTASGAAEIRAIYEGGFKAMKMQCELQIDRIVEDDAVATAQTHSIDRVTMLDSGMTSEITYRELFVLRRSGDEWRISDYMFNSPA